MSGVGARPQLRESAISHTNNTFEQTVLSVRLTKYSKTGFFWITPWPVAKVEKKASLNFFLAIYYCCIFVKRKKKKLTLFQQSGIVWLCHCECSCANPIINLLYCAFTLWLNLLSNILRFFTELHKALYHNKLHL